MKRISGKKGFITKYICPNCINTFERKSHLINHFKNKKPCKSHTSFYINNNDRTKDVNNI